MQKSLFRQYFAICAWMIFITILVLGAILLMFAGQYFKEEEQNRLSRNVQQAYVITMADYRSHNYLYLSQGTLSTGFSLLGNSIDATIFLTDDQGKTLVCTEEGNCEHMTYTIPQDILEKTARGEYRETGLLGGVYKKPYYTVAIPVMGSENVPIGYIFASSSTNNLQFFLKEMLNMFVLSALTVISIAFIVVYFITQRMVRPLQNMLHATQSFIKGDFTVRVPVTSTDEIGQLATAFNNMAVELASLESARRSFVSNVSHELKTPMTTIGGFIDGILDGTIPPEKHNQYLKIVSDEVKRLSRLVRSMLGIARIEAGEMKVNIVPVDIHEIVCSTVFTFEQAIEAKHLDVRGLDQPKLMVKADPDLIYQVIYNLIDNAVKFVNEGGYLEFGYKVEGAKAYVSIRNSGEGLSKDEIGKIFDRFYKSDKSRSLDKNGVGLGLHIVRSVINLHEGEIFVRSVEGEYTEFVFSLPILTAKEQKNLLKK